MIVKRFYDEGLAQASYLVGCASTGEALVVDPNRHLEQYLEAAESEGLRLTHVTETHIHADFASGSKELAEAAGANLYLSDEGDADWKYAFAADARVGLLHHGESFMVGNIRITALHTPGHTPEHLSFLVTDTPATDKPMGVFTGDFVFVGDVGRPDLLERAANVAGAMEPSARTLFRSLQHFKQFPDHLQIWPGHGAGSACGKSLGGVPQSTVGYERIANWALLIRDEDEFVRAVLAGQPDPPAYFAEMKRINKLGPPKRRTAIESAQFPAGTISNIEISRWVVDARPSEKFAESAIPGTINIPLNRSFVNWAGWLLPYDRPLTFLVTDEEERDDIHAALTTIGLEQKARYVIGDFVSEWCAPGRVLQRMQSADPRDLRRGAEPSYAPVILDVRQLSEWETSRIPGALHIPLGSLQDRLGEIPRDRAVIVTCQAGTRSPIAASILRANGFEEVAHLRGGLDALEKSGGEVEFGPARNADYAMTL